MNKSQIALNTISIAQPSFEEVLRASARAGFKQLEFNLPLMKKWIEAGRSVADVKALLAEYGLRCVGGFETTVQSFGAADARAKNHALLRANAELLAELGGGVMVAGTDGPDAGQPADLGTLETIGRTTRELAEAFPQSVSLAIEFNWSPVVKSIRAAAAVAKAADHPRVGILFDPAHYHCTSSKFEDLTPAVIAKILHFHVDDMRDKPGELSNCNSDRVLPGEGTLDVKGLIARLEAHGYRGLFSIELFNKDIWALPPEAAAQKCYASMERLATE
ncbi:MAG: sugar phosphate isomerase/epimerase [Planctomycetota bacterium]|nr:sugar phosphate isomerase/epimerase [Planctomycetota bacterium]